MRVTVHIVKCRGHRINVRASRPSTRTLPIFFMIWSSATFDRLPKAPAANDHQCDEHPHHHHHPEIAPARQVGKRLAHQLIEAADAQVSLQEFRCSVYDVRRTSWRTPVGRARY